MPASLTLAWNAAGGHYSADIGFDATEPVAAFHQLAAGDRQGPMSLVLEPAGDCATVGLSLRHGDLLHRFARKTVEVYGD